MKVLYRYIDRYPCNEGDDSDIFCESYRILRHTKCGVWINADCQERFVLNNARKKYAYPTKKEALRSFKIRKSRQLQHIIRQNDHVVNIISTLDKAENSADAVDFLRRYRPSTGYKFRLQIGLNQ